VPSYNQKFAPKLDADGNKIKRQWPKVIDGVKFASPLEYYAYQQFQEHHISFEFQKKFVFIKPFRYGGEAISGISLTVDFWLPVSKIIVDPKGLQNDGNVIKWKMLKRMLLMRGQEPRIVFLTSQKAVREFIYMLDNGFTQEVKESALNARISKLKKVSALRSDGVFYSRDGVVCTRNDLSTMTDYDFGKLLNSLTK